MARRSLSYFGVLLAGLLVVGLVALVIVLVRPAESVFSVSRETTYLTEPLMEDGWPDYIRVANERLSEGVTPENNAAVLICQALGPTLGGERPVPDRLFELLGIAKPPADGDYFIDPRTFVAASDKEQADVEDDRDPLNDLHYAVSGPWRAESMPLIAAWLARNERPLKLVVEASHRSQYFWPVVLPENEPTLAAYDITIPLGLISTALQSRAMLHMANGDVESAWQDLMSVRRLGRVVGQRPFNELDLSQVLQLESSGAYSQGVLLENVELDAATAQRFLRDLDALPELPDVADVVDFGGRLSFLHTTANMARSNKRKLLEDGGFLDRLRGRLAVGSIDWDVVLRLGNEWFDRTVQALRMPDGPARDRRIQELAAEYKELIRPTYGHRADDAQKLVAEAEDTREAVSNMIGRHLLKFSMVVPDHMLEFRDRGVQRGNNVRIGLALAAYRGERGSYPRELADLVPDYLREIPDDVYSGQAPIYRPAGDGYVLYSFGVDEDDDGGRTPADGPDYDDLVLRVRAEGDLPQD